MLQKNDYLTKLVKLVSTCAKRLLSQLGSCETKIFKVKDRICSIEVELLSSLQTPIKAEECPVKDILSDKFLFLIPTYQRPFSWERDNFQKLFTDIYDSMKESEGKSVYFLGSTVFYNKEENKHEVIDGQQRLVSLTVLLATIRDFIKNEEYKQTLQRLIYQRQDLLLNKPKAERIVPWENLKEHFEKYIYEPGKIRRFLDDFRKKKIPYQDKDDPIYHLYECVKTFHDQITEQFSKLNGQRDFESFIKYLLNNVYVVYITTSSRTSAIRLFNVLNTRGLPLSPIDIIKSVNLEAISDKAMQDSYAKKWIALENDLGREEMENLISHVRTMKAKEKAKVSLPEEYEELSKKKKLEKGEKFFDYIESMAQIYKNKILDAEVDIKKEAQRNRYKILIELMNTYLPFNDWIPPVLAFSEKFDQADEFLTEFISRLEKKVFIEWVAGFTRTERITSFSRIIELIEKRSDPEEVVHKMLTYKPRRIERGRFINFINTNEINKILDVINDEQLYTLKGGKLAKYVLLRLDMELWDLAVFQGYRGTVTIEHILPRTPPKNSEWAKKFDEQERTVWTNRLGNLVLLSGSKNSEAGYFDFKKKKEVYFKKKCTPFRLTQGIFEYDDWNINTLKQRHKELMQKLKQIYSEETVTMEKFFDKKAES